MRMYIDSANLKAIEKTMDQFPVVGVTTNPSLLAKEGTNPLQTVKGIRDLLGNAMELHVQVISTEAEEMIKEGYAIREALGQNTFIKVPVIGQGIKAMKKLAQEGVNITATAIYTPMQALMAAVAGAKWTAPYINRLDKIGANGTQVAIDIQNILSQYPVDTHLLAASFKNVEQVLTIARAGATAITAAPDILEELIYHPLTEQAVNDFIEDFEKISFKGATMLKVLDK